MVCPPAVLMQASHLGTETHMLTQLLLALGNLLEEAVTFAGGLIAPAAFGRHVAPVIGLSAKE